MKKFILIVLSFLLSQSSDAQDWLTKYNKSVDQYNNYDLAAAKITGESALALFTIEVKEPHKNKAAILRHLVLICYEGGYLEEGVAFAIREQGILEALDLQDEEAYGRMLYNMGLLRTALGDYHEAKSILVKSKDLLLVYHEETDLEIAEVVGNLAISQFYLHDWKACEASFQSSISSMELLEEQSPEYANILYTYGEYCLKSGQYEEAVDALLPIKEAYEQEGPSEDYGSILVKIASGYEKIQALDSAKRFYIQAIDLFQSLSAYSHEDYLIGLHNLSFIYQNEGQLTEAIALLSEIVSQQQLAKDELYYQALANLGHIYYSDGLMLQASKAYQEVINDGTTGSQPYFMASTGLALVLNLQGAYQQSLETSDQALVQIGEQSTLKVGLLKAKAAALSSLGRYAETETTLTEALSLVKSNEAESLLINMLLGGLYTITNQLEKADILYLEVHPRMQGSASTEPLAYANYLGNYATFLQASGAFNAAEKALEESIEIKESALGEQSASYFSSLESLGVLYLTTGKYALARSLLQKVERLKESEATSDAKAYTKSNLGIIARVTGDYEDSEDYFKTSLSLYEEVFGRQHPFYAGASNELGLLYLTMGNTKAARSQFQHALHTFESVGNKQQLDYVSVLENLASLNFMEGNVEESKHQLEEVLEIDKVLLGTAHPLYSKTLHNLASTLEELEEFDRAAELYNEALLIYEHAFGRTHPSYANTLYNLAVLEQELEHYDQALIYYQDAVEIRTKLLNEDHPDIAFSYFGLASLKQKTGDLAGAQKDYKVVIDQYLKSINHFFPSLSEEEKSAFYAKIKPVFESYQDFAIEYVIEDHGDDASRAQVLGSLYNLQLSTKALLLNASNKIRRIILSSENTVLVEKFNEWQAVKESLVKSLNMSNEELAKNNINILGLQNQSNELEKEISKMSEAFAGEFEKKQITWQMVQNELSPSEAAIEILRIKKNVKNDSVYYAALINRGSSGSTPDLVIIRDALTMESKYFKQYKNLIVFKMDNDRSYGQFWSAIDEQLKGVDKIYLSSDGVYNKINISTLYDPSKKEYVFDKYTIYLLSNTKELLEVKSIGSQQESNTAAIFGYPDYNLGGAALASTASTERGFSEGISELPGTLDEINNISQTLDDNFWKYERFERDQANEVNVKNIKSPKLLHIATHGFFMQDKDMKKGGMGGIQTREAKYNPLFRSGLLLAGAAKTFKGESLSYDEDGILTAYEAMNLHLDHTELVVMSACETGLGEVKNGEGVYGLQRAFIVAGADNLIMSLWKVNDETTQKLMSRFYSNWIGGQPKKAAFHDAIESLKKEYKQPYYWGAFVMLGN